jgi:hypothetical protein
MTGEQRKAIDRADASMRPAMELYEHRNKISVIVGRLELRDLKRLTAVLAKLSDRDLKRVAAYAEGLAEWNETEQPSGDAPVP